MHINQVIIFLETNQFIIVLEINQFIIFIEINQLTIFVQTGVFLSLERLFTKYSTSMYAGLFPFAVPRSTLTPFFIPRSFRFPFRTVLSSRALRRALFLSATPRRSHPPLLLLHLLSFYFSPRSPWSRPSFTLVPWSLLVLPRQPRWTGWRSR